MKVTFLSLLVIVFAILSSSNASAANRFSVATGNWNATSTWSATSGGASGAAVPVAGDVVTIEGGFTVTIQSAAACASITIGTTTAGTLTFNSGTNRTLAVTGNISIASGSSFTCSNAGGDNQHVLNLGGNLTVDGTFNMVSAGDDGVGVTFNGSSTQTISGSGATCTFQQLTISNTSSSGVVLSRNVVLTPDSSTSADLTISSSDIFDLSTFTCNRSAAGGTLTVSGTLKLGNNTGGQTGSNFPTNFSTMTLTGGTLDYNGSNALTQTVFATPTYENLTLTNGTGSGSAAKNSTASFAVNGTFTVNSGVVFTPAAANTVTGSSNTISGSGTIQVTRTAATPDYNSQYTFSTDTLSSMTVDYAGAGAQTINAFTYGSLVTSGSGTKTMSGATIVNSACTIGSGTTLDEAAIQMTLLGGATLTVNGTLNFSSSTGLIRSGTTGTTTLTMGAGGLIQTTDDSGLGPATGASLQTQVGGAWSLTNVDTVGTVEYTRAIATTQVVTDRNYNNLTITGTTLKTWTLAAGRTVNGNFTINSGPAPLTMSGTFTVDVKGDWSNGGTYTKGTETVSFSGTAAQAIGGANATSFTNLTIANTSATVSANTNVNVSGTMTVNASALFSPAAAVVVNTGGAAGTITGSGTIQVTRTAATADYVSQYKFSTNTLTSMTVDYAGAAAQTVNSTVGNYGALKISTSGTKTLQGAVTVNGGVTIASGTTLDVTASNFAMNVGGDWTNNGGTFTPQGGTVTFNSAVAQAINGTAATQTFNKLTVNKSAQTLSVAGSTTTLTLNSDLTLTAGGFSAGTATTINVAGNWTNNSATGFTSGSSNVVFNAIAAQTIGGSQPTSFNGLTTSNSAGVALGINATVTGVLDLANGDIRTGVTPTFAFTLFQTGTSSASGTFDVVGNVNRTDLNVAGAKSFGNVNVQLTRTAGTTNDVTVNLVKGASSLTGSVLREYGITLNNGSMTATVRLRYLDTERQGNGENSGPICTLQLWKKTGTTWSAQGSTACDSSANWAELSGVVAFSQWTLKETGAPTACKLEGFQAARSDDGVVLEWRTGYEVNNVGFNIYRQGADGEMVKLTKHMVAGSGLMVRKNTVLTSGLAYYWSDPDTKKGDHPQYWLEDLDADGHTSWNGPFIINEALVPTRPTPGGKAAPGEKGGRGDANSMTINSISEENEQNGVYQPSGPVESTAKVGKMKLAAAVQQGDLAGKSAVKISIKQEGWYRITQAQLVAAGLSTSTDVKKLQLFADSQEIPIIVGGNGRGFDSSGYIEFYGQGLDTPSTDTRVYWLIVGANGLRIKSFTGLSGGNAGDSFQYTVQRKDRLFYRSEIQNGDAENFFGAFIYSQPTDQAMTVNRIASAANTTLEIALQGFNAGPHQVQVSLNGAIVGTLSFNDRVRQVFTLTAPQALLTEGANKVTLQALAGSSDFSFVDYIKLTYAHKFEAENNGLKLTAPGSSIVTLNGFTGGNIRVVDVTDPKAVQELLAKPSQGNTTPTTSITVVTLAGGTRSLLAFVDTKQASKIAANKPSSLRQGSNQADLVIIGAGDFSSSLQSLQSLRQGQGIQTILVDVEDVYDEFSFGQKSPNALKDFLSYARTNWKKAPKYVLLGGMASFDPRNYMGLGNTDFVPTKIVMTEHLETASDDWFVDFNNDGMPEMALGRLPARNADEAARMVQKLVNYDQSASGAGVLLVADVNKGFDFEHNNDLLKSIVPNTTAVQDIRRASDPQAHQNLIDALNQGKKLVNYTGHGSVDIWEASLLTSTDAAGLANAQKLSLVVAMTCLNGYFFDERFESLAHALVNAQNGGAVAVWSSTGLTEPDPQSLADQELFRQLFAGASVRLGDAALKAKAVITDSDVRRTWVLIGDPTMRFKQ